MENERECFEEIAYKGYTVLIEIDEYPLNPREESDCLGTIYYGRSRNCIYGDKEVDGIDGLANELGLYKSNGDDFEEEEEEAICKALSKDYIWIDVNFCSLNICAVSKDTIRKEYGWKNITKKRIAQIEKYLQSEVDEFTAYCEGEVYCYNIHSRDNEEIDGCCGIYGDSGLEYLKEDAKSIIDYHIKYELKAKYNQLKSYIRGNVPLIYRFV